MTHETAHTDHEPVRVTKGRRLEDRHRNIEIHPVAVSVVGGTITLLLMVSGYFFKGWADNMMNEIHLLRTAAEKQLTETATNNEWRNGMSKWRDDVDVHLKDVDNRLDTLPWSVPRKNRRPAQATKQQPQPYDGGAK